MKGVYLKEPLNVLSCAVQGRPGRSAYEIAAAEGYTGTPEQFAALLSGLSATLSAQTGWNGRVNALLELLDNRVSDLELAVAALQGGGGGA